MQAEEGKRVRLSFICRLEDGTLYDFTDRDLLEFVVGQGNTLPTLEMGVLGMKPGEQRTIRVPATELEEFPFEPEEAPVDAGFPAGTTDVGYEFAPGDEGDVATGLGAGLVMPRQKPPSDGWVIFDVELIEVTDADVVLEA